MCEGVVGERVSVCKGFGVGASLVYLRSGRIFLWIWSKGSWGF